MTPDPDELCDVIGDDDQIRCGLCGQLLAECECPEPEREQPEPIRYEP